MGRVGVSVRIGAGYITFFEEMTIESGVGVKTYLSSKNKVLVQRFS